MPGPLTSQHGPAIARQIAAMIERVHPVFPTRAFVAQALRGEASLTPLSRARHLARAMTDHLPRDYPAALDVVLRSLGPPAPTTSGGGIASSLLYLPHVHWVAGQGLDHLDDSVRAMHAITQRCAFELGLRPFVERHPRAMLAVLERWCDDPSPQVRRLVSEGLRPRLPRAPRLRVFERDPRPVLALLERLRDDPDGAVRRSVANHLDDLGRADPARLVEVCTRWARGAPPQRAALIGHALRTLVGRGDPHALTVLGYGGRPRIELRAASIVPARVPLGGAVEIAFEIASTSTARRAQRLLVDLRVSCAGAARVGVFKLDAGELGAGEAFALRKRLSLRRMTARAPRPGRYRVEALVNGVAYEVGAFGV